MADFETLQLTLAARARGEDRIAVFHSEGRVVIVVADGAGGVGSGDLAADAVIDAAKIAYATTHTADQWRHCLIQLDSQISLGETTAVVVDVTAAGVEGASVGDSCAWMIDGEHFNDLTRNQVRKPLLGSGSACPTRIEPQPLQGILLVATDGFCNYCKRERLTALIAQSDFFEIPRRCAESVRLPSGDLWDDIGIVVCRQSKLQRTRQRYAI